MKAATMLRHVSWPYLRRRRLRTALAFVSVMLAVALYVSTRTTEYSVLRTFDESAAALAGGAEWTVRRPGGVPAEALRAVEAVEGVRAAPVIQRSAACAELRLTLTVLGIDYGRDARLRRYPADGQFDLARLLLDPKAVVIARPLAEAHGLRMGDPLTLGGSAGATSYTIAGIVADTGPMAALGGRIVVMPIPAAQSLFEWQGRYDRIDLAGEAKSDEAALLAALPKGCVLEPARRQNAVLTYSLSQMRIISTALTSIAAMIGLFIIYNSASLAVVERTAEIGTLRALGARRRDVIGVLFAEALALGVPAAMAGLGVGLFLAGHALEQTAANVNTLMQLVEVRRTYIPPDVWIVAPLLGAATAVAGSLVPARAAARLEPIAAINPARRIRRQTGRMWKWFLVALPMGVLSVGVFHHRRTPAMLGVACFLVMLLAFALALPQFVVWVTAPARRLARRRRGIAAYLAFDNVAKFPSRSSLTVVAFAGSLSLVVGTGAMIRGLETAVTRWMDELFCFDLSFGPHEMVGSAYSEAVVPGELLEVVRADDRVAEAAGIRGAFVPYRGATILIIAHDVEPFWRMVCARSGGEPAEVEWLVAALAGGAVGISDNFARLHDVGVGDRVELETPEGPRDFRVAFTRQDYSWPMGIVLMDRSVYRAIWRDTDLTFVDVLGRPGVDLDALQTDLLDRLRARTPVFSARMATIREYGQSLLRDWFNIAHAQVFVAVVIGAVGVANTLLVSLLTQARQIGLLRAVGGTRRQVRAMLRGEALLLGAVSAALGIAMGLVIAWRLVPVMIARESGYVLPFVMPWGTTALVVAAGLAIAWAASMLPIRAARRLDVVRAVTVE